MKKGIVLYILLCAISLITSAQTQNIVLKDTIGDFVFDALVTEMGTVPQKNSNLVKYFKYIGSDSVIIFRAWTGDPHYICEYPALQILKKDSIYSFAVCFWHQNRQGQFHKIMGFDFSNGQRVSLVFKGFVDTVYINPLETK